MRNGSRKVYVLWFREHKAVLAAAIWLAAGVYLYVLNTRRPSHITPDSSVEEALQSVSAEKNRLGRCWFGITDPNDKQPVGTVSFESLQTSAASAGLFKTAALRSMDIQQLKIDLSGSASTSLTNTIIDPTKKSSCPAYQPWYQVLLQKFYFYSSDEDNFLKIPMPEFSHLVHIQISDFQCRFFEEQNVLLDIRSKRASVELKRASEVYLRGHVVIRSPEAVLECNSVRWDIQSKTFLAQGFYIIRKGNDLEKGNDGYFDWSLNTITQQKTFAYQGEMP